jgi:hypothetical protein
MAAPLRSGRIERVWGRKNRSAGPRPPIGREDRQRRAGVIPHAVIRKTHGRRANVLLEPVKTSGTKAGRSKISEQTTGLARVQAADMKSEYHASTRAESTRFSKGLCGLSACGSPTNVLIAVYRQHD